MALTPAEVRNVSFSPTRFQPGYNEREVDAFLDRVESELDRLHTDNQTLQAENAQLKQQLAALAGNRSAPQAPTQQMRAVPPAAPGGQPPAGPGYGGSITDAMRPRQ